MSKSRAILCLWMVNGFLLRFSDGQDAHRRPVVAIAFSPDGTMLATASIDGRLKLWRVEGLRLIHDIGADPYGVLCLAFVEKRKLIAGGFNREVIWVDAESGKVLRRLPQAHSGFISAIEPSPDRRVIATGGDDGYIRLREISTGKLLREWRADRYCVFDISFSPDGRRLVSGGWEKQVKVWQIPDGKLLRQWHAHNSWVRSVEFNPDGSYFATGGMDDGLVRFWDSKTYRLIASVEAESANRITALEHDPTGKWMASAGGSARLWDMEEGVLIRSFRFKGDFCHCISVAISPDGKLLSAGAWDGSIAIWQLGTGALLGESRPETY